MVAISTPGALQKRGECTTPSRWSSDVWWVRRFQAIRYRAPMFRDFLKMQDLNRLPAAGRHGRGVLLMKAGILVRWREGSQC